MRRSSFVIGLVEDERKQRFVRRYLYRVGYSTHAIRFELLPAGRGSGAQWVLDRYAGVVTEYRSRSARAMTALVVAIDADDGRVVRRQQQFRELAARTAGDRIAHLIPKWSIETWILGLSGEPWTRIKPIAGRRISTERFRRRPPPSSTGAVQTLRCRRTAHRRRETQYPRSAGWSSRSLSLGPCGTGEFPDCKLILTLFDDIERIGGDIPEGLTQTAGPLNLQGVGLSGAA